MVISYKSLTVVGGIKASAGHSPHADAFRVVNSGPIILVCGEAGPTEMWGHVGQPWFWIDLIFSPYTTRYMKLWISVIQLRRLLTTHSPTHHERLEDSRIQGLGRIGVIRVSEHHRLGNSRGSKDLRIRGLMVIGVDGLIGIIDSE